MPTTVFAPLVAACLVQSVAIEFTSTVKHAPFEIFRTPNPAALLDLNHKTGASPSGGVEPILPVPESPFTFDLKDSWNDWDGFCFGRRIRADQDPRINSPEFHHRLNELVKTAVRGEPMPMLIINTAAPLPPWSLNSSMKGAPLYGFPENPDVEPTSPWLIDTSS